MAEAETLTRNALIGRQRQSAGPGSPSPLSFRAEDLSRRLQSAYEPVSSALIESERIFQDELGSKSEFVQQLVDQAGRFRGKQLRPALLLLTAEATGGINSAHPVLAAVVEMIHTATLVHDDILDDAEIRRHTMTINAQWGNEAAVLLGDYLFTHAFHLASSLETTEACRLIGRATNLVCEGELQQVHHRGDLNLAESEYYEIVQGKTAELTAVSCRLGARYAGADAPTCESLDQFGRDLGVAFQIADDVLDLWGEETSAGKTLGTDLEKQKLTLPVILLLKSAEREQALEIRRLLTEASADARRALRPMLISSGALEESWQRARRFVDSALAAVTLLPESQARESLVELTRLVLRRSS